MDSGFIQKMVSRMVAPIVNRVQMMVTKAVIDQVKDGNNIQLLKVGGLAGEVLDNVERIQNYGLSSNPPREGETVILCVGGNKDHPIAIAADSGADRKTGLASGEVAIYHKNGSFIYLKNNGDIQLVPSSEKVDIIGNLEASGEVKDSVGTLDELRTDFNTFVSTVYNTHIHQVAAAPGPSGPPTPTG